MNRQVFIQLSPQSGSISRIRLLRDRVRDCVRLVPLWHSDRFDSQGFSETLLVSGNLNRRNVVTNSHFKHQMKEIAWKRACNLPADERSRRDDGLNRLAEIVSGEVR